MRHPTNGRVLAASVATLVVMGVLNIVVTAWLFRSLCGVIGAQVDVYRAEPPSTPTGAALAEEWVRLRRVICRV